MTIEEINREIEGATITTAVDNNGNLEIAFQKPNELEVEPPVCHHLYIKGVDVETDVSSD